MQWHSIYSGPTTIELRGLLARRSEFYLTDEHEAVLSLLAEHVGYIVHVSEVAEKMGWARNRAIRVMEEVAEAFQLPRAEVSSPYGRGEVYVWGKVIESGAWSLDVEMNKAPSYSSVRSTETSNVTATPARQRANPSPSRNLAPARSSAPNDDRTERVTPRNSGKRVALAELSKRRPELARTCALLDVVLDVKNVSVHDTFVETWDGRYGALAGDFTRREAIDAATRTLERGSTSLDDIGTALAAIMRELVAA